MLKMNGLGIAAMQRSMWRQRSRIAWLRDGDASTRFFHSKANARRRKSYLHRIEFEGQVFTEQEEKEDALWKYFDELIGTKKDRPHSLNFQFLGLDAINLSELDLPISSEEAKAALMEMHNDKAPGPDGFTALFFKKSWDVIVADIMRAIRAIETCRTDRMELLNDATLILLPKSPAAAHPREFRPISLINFFAKLVTKVFAIRLSPRMDELVSPCQNAFIKRRSIHDNFIYVQSQAKLFRQSKTPAIMLKLDIEKAFDTVSWQFLLEVLEARGFSLHCRDLIAALLASASTKILVNGCLTETIHHCRGLRQGDPLSPLLFDIVMDSLARMIAAADNLGALQQIGCRPLPHRVSLYADDVVIFIRPEISEFLMIKAMLQAFSEATGLHTNFAKSTFTPIHCNDIDLDALSVTLGCPVAQFPCRYLGMPLSDRRLRKCDLQPALDKLNSKVKGWIQGSFSIDARLILVKHVLAAMPIFQMLSIAPPVWLSKAMDKLSRGFFWAKDEVAPGGKCLVKWQTVCRPTTFGGLGVRDLQAASIALRMHWLWQTWMAPTKPWQGLPLPIDDKVRSLFAASVIFHLGDGERLSFWSDCWLDGMCIKEMAPNLFKMCTRKKLTIAQAMLDQRWTRHLKRDLPHLAVIEMVAVWEKLQGVALQPGTPDSVSWRWTADGTYTAASAYVVQFIGSTQTSYTSCIWASDAPLRCRIFAWLAVQGRCLTADMLAKRGWPHNDGCTLCTAPYETAQHLLGACPMMLQVWCIILPMANLPACFLPSQDQSLLEWLSTTRGMLPKIKHKGWNSLTQLVWWSLWKERNKRIFQARADTMASIIATILGEADLWLRAGRQRVCELLHRPREPD
jgi:hypothetical protein